MTTQDANPVCRMHFNVTGMSCAACQARVEKVVSGLDGVENVAVNLLKNTMEVTPKDASQADELKPATALSARIPALKMLPRPQAVRKPLPPRLRR